MTGGTFTGIFLVLVLIIGIGVYSGKKVQNSGDFLTGSGKAGSWLVCGSIMGSLVSSQATIGTAQLAFHYGLAAWWFTLGSGIGCLLLALIYAGPLRHSKCITELQIIGNEYGSLAGSLGSILCSIGIFVSVLAQMVACTGLLTVLFPSLSTAAATVISVAVMCFYVIFGGAWGAGMGGVMKLLLLYLASAVGMAYVLITSIGLTGLMDGLNHMLAGTSLGTSQDLCNLSNLFTSSDISDRFFNLVARGTAKDVGSGLSLLLGVLSTQTYAQAVWSARTDQKAKQGALLSAFLIPPIGIAGICIGLFMRTHYITQAEADALLSLGKQIPQVPVLQDTIQVFPVFLTDHLPPLFSGIILGTLLITVVGGGAGLSLGMATILVEDVYKRFSRSRNFLQNELVTTRTTIGAVLIAAAMITIVVPSETINDLGFLSMGLRGSVVFLPLSCALWLRGKIDRRFVVASIVLSPLAVLTGKWFGCSYDPLFLGVTVSVVCCGAGYFQKSLGQSVSNR